MYFYRDGGPPMHAILLIGFLGFAIVVERTWCFARWLRVDARRLSAGVRTALLGGDTTTALRLCAARRSPLERVLHAGVMACVDRYRAEVSVHEARVEWEPMLRRRLNVLSSLAGLACLVGLLGTVFGLIGEFRTCAMHVAAAETTERTIAHGISAALNTSGFGILVAVLLLSAKMVLVNASEKLAGDLAAGTARFLDVVGLVREPTRVGSPYRGSSS